MKLLLMLVGVAQAFFFEGMFNNGQFHQEEEQKQESRPKECEGYECKDKKCVASPLYCPCPRTASVKCSLADWYICLEPSRKCSEFTATAFIAT